MDCHESNLLWRGELCRYDDIALVLPILRIDQDEGSASAGLSDNVCYRCDRTH